MYYYSIMNILEKLTNWWQKLIVLGQNFLVSEDQKIQKILDLPVDIMKDLLPKSPVYSKDLFVLFDYDNKIVRIIVKSIKYKNNASLRKRIAIYLHEEIVDLASEIALFEGTPPLLVPMPMSKMEKRGRGFNQCEELVKEIKKLGGASIEVSYNTLKKIRETQRQTKLSREERLENIKESMSANNFTVVGRVIIVLDDVYTTGASLTEARRALLAAGAKRAVGLFIAH
jgi:ComF family protein